MKFIKFFVLGILFGMVMVKSEAVSWYRIQEMFRFQSFHMFGIIGTAVCFGALGIFLIKKYQLKNIQGEIIQIEDKPPGRYRYLTGGLIFGLGWALTGLCPGSLFVSLGAGYISIVYVFLGSIIGTYLYGIVAKKLPE